jgi:hypothetical protein
MKPAVRGAHHRIAFDLEDRPFDYRHPWEVTAKALPCVSESALDSGEDDRETFRHCTTLSRTGSCSTASCLVEPDG